MDAKSALILNKILQSASTIGITTHIESDADGMVAAFALQRLLACQGLQSCIISDGESLQSYEFLGGKPQVKAFETGMVYDTLFVLDCNALDRLGVRAALLQNARQIVMIDHHVLEPNGIKADFSIVDTSFVSAGAIIYQVFHHQIQALEPADRLYIANCVYVTIINDTNNFVNDNTDSEVFRLAAELQQQGVKPLMMYQGLMLNNSAAEMRYIGSTLATIELVLNKRLLIMHSSYAMKVQCDVKPEEFKQATRYVQGVRDIDGLAYFREDAPGEWKLSLRSVHLDVQKIAAKYGGGGHKQASGCSISGSLDEIKALLIQDFEEALEAHERLYPDR